VYLIQALRLTRAEHARLLDLTRLLDLAPGPGGSRISEPILTKRLFAEAIGDLVYKEYQSTVIALYPSSQLVAHRDPPIKGIRHHIPLQLNPGCWVFHDGLWQQLEVGCVYTMDPSLLHGAVNWGTEVRLHLMVDTR